MKTSSKTVPQLNEHLSTVTERDHDGGMHSTERPSSLYFHILCAVVTMLSSPVDHPPHELTFSFVITHQTTIVQRTFT